MTAAHDFDDIIEQGLSELDARWGDGETTGRDSYVAAAELSSDFSDDPCTGVHQRIVLPTGDAIPTWDDQTAVDRHSYEYAIWSEEGRRAGMRDAADYRYRKAPPRSELAVVAYYQKQHELVGEALRKYVDGFVEGALSRIRRRKPWVARALRRSRPDKRP